MSIRYWKWILLVVGLAYWIGISDTPERSETRVSTDLATGTSVQRDRSVYLYVTGNRVNQREGAGTSFRPLGRLNKGARVRYISQSDGWTEIVSSLGKGWMSSQYLSASRPSKPAPVAAKPKRDIAAPTNNEIRAARKAIIRQSIASYPGNCPCPYNKDRAGRRCGKRSAWSRPGGYSPICYDSDVSDARLKTYIARRRGASN